MILSRGSSSRLAIIADQRFKSDQGLDETERARNPHVLDMYVDAKRSMGPRYYASRRIALFDYKDKPTTVERQRARDRLLNTLRDEDIRVACVIPTASVDDDKEQQEATTVAWPAFRAPDSLEEMRGTFFEWEPGRYVMSLFPRAPYLKQLQRWQQGQWLNRAWSFAHGQAELERCPVKCYRPDARMYSALNCMKGKPIAVDIENIQDKDLITAIGISDGYYSCAVEWDEYFAYNHEWPEPGLHGYALGHIIERQVKDLLGDENTPKIFHNHTFDVPRLERAGVPIRGPIHDTFCAHGIAYPELRHGLQHACASLLNIIPWKSLYHPKLPGVTRDDIEYWIADPLKLLDYNADDAFHTLQLARALLPQVQQEVFTCNPIKRFA